MPDITSEQLAKAVDGMEIVVDLLGDVVPGTRVGAKIRYPGSFASDILARCAEQDVPPEHQADPDEDARAAWLTRRWVKAIDAALASAGEAQGILRELERDDIELCEGAEGATVKAALAGAWHQLYAAGDIAQGRLKLIEYAELAAEVQRLRTADSEVARLRAEVDQLQQRLAAHCSVCGDETPVSGAADAFDLAPGKSRRCHSPASHGYCGYTPPPVLCDNPDHHDHLTPDPIEGEGSDLD